MSAPQNFIIQDCLFNHDGVNAVSLEAAENFMVSNSVVENGVIGITVDHDSTGDIIDTTICGCQCCGMVVHDKARAHVENAHIPDFGWCGIIHADDALECPEVSPENIELCSSSANAVAAFCNHKDSDNCDWTVDTDRGVCCNDFSDTCACPACMVKCDNKNECEPGQRCRALPECSWGCGRAKFCAGRHSSGHHEIMTTGSQ